MLVIECLWGFAGSLEGEGLHLHGRRRVLGRLSRAHGLQRTLAKLPQLCSLGAATGKGEGEMLRCPELRVLPLGRGWCVRLRGHGEGAVRLPCSSATLRQHPREVPCAGSFQLTRG